MDWKLELVSVPVSDVDRAIAFYVDQVGFVLDHDHHVSEDLRFVQITPRGSGCSIALGVGISSKPPGSVEGLQVVVSDVAAARAELAGRGVDVTGCPALGATSSSSATPTATAGRSSSFLIAGLKEGRQQRTAEPTSARG